MYATSWNSNTRLYFLCVQLCCKECELRKEVYSFVYVKLNKYYRIVIVLCPHGSTPPYPISCYPCPCFLKLSCVWCFLRSRFLHRFHQHLSQCSSQFFSIVLITFNISLFTNYYLHIFIPYSIHPFYHFFTSRSQKLLTFSYPLFSVSPSHCV